MGEIFFTSDHFFAANDARKREDRYLYPEPLKMNGIFFFRIKRAKTIHPVKKIDQRVIPQSDDGSRHDAGFQSAADR